MWYIPARLRIHACSAYEPRPHLFVDLYGSYHYLASAEWRSYTSLPLFEDSRQICVLHDPYGMHGDTQASAWSRALPLLGHVRVAQSQ